MPLAWGSLIATLGEPRPRRRTAAAAAATGRLAMREGRRVKRRAEHAADHPLLWPLCVGVARRARRGQEEEQASDHDLIIYEYADPPRAECLRREPAAKLNDEKA